MTLLEEFVFSLSKNDLKKIRPLQFRGVKKKVFFSILRAHERASIDAISIERQYRLSKNRYYQIHSEILEACSTDLFQDNSTKLLLSLGEKQLFRHFLHEMKRQEERLQKRSGNLENYYFQVLLMKNLFLINRTLHKTLYAELDAYAKRYVEVKEPHPDDSHFLKIYELSNAIDDLTYTRFNQEELALYVEELERLYNLVKDGDHILAKFTACDSLMILFAQRYLPDKTPEPYARCGLRIIDEFPEAFEGVRDFYRFECSWYLPKAEQYTVGDMKQFLTYSSQTFGPAVYHIGRMLPKILDANEVEWVSKFIDKFFPYNIDLLPKDAALTYTSLLMIYHIHANNYVEGKKLLQKAFMLNTGKYQNLSSTLFLRSYDAFFAAMLEDPLSAELTIERHLRFVRHYGYKKGQGKVIGLLTAISQMLKCVGYDRKKAEEIRKEFTTSKVTAGFGFMIQKLYNKYFSK